MKDSFFHSLVSIAVKCRWLIFIALFVSAIFSATLATGIRFDFSPEALFVKEELEFARETHKVFDSHSRHIVFVLEATTAEDVFSPEALNWQYQVLSKIAKTRVVRRPQGLPTIRVPNKLAFMVKSGKTDWLFETKEHDAESANRLRERVLGIEEFHGTVVSKDLKCAQALLVLRDKDERIDQVAEVVGTIRKVIQENPCPEGYRVHVSGIHSLRANIIDELKADQKFLLPLAGFLLLLVMIALFRCSGGVVLPSMALGFGLLWTIALLAGCQQRINVITNVLPVVLLVIGASNCVHILSRYSEEAVAGVTRRQAICRTMTHMIPACFLTTLTTAIGFLSLLFAGTDLLKGFGWQSALGLGLVFLSIVLVFTGAGSYFRPPKLRSEQSSGKPGLIERLPCFAFDRPWLIQGLVVVPIVIALGFALGWFGTPGLHVNSYLVETLDESHPEIESLRVIEKELGGFLPVEVVLQCDDPEHLTSLETIDKIRNIQSEMSKHKDVTLVQSFVDVIKLVDHHTLGKPAIEPNMPLEDTYRTYHRLDTIKTALRRHRRSSGIGHVLSEDETQAKILINLKDIGTRRAKEVVQKLQKQVQKEFPEEYGIETRVTGEMYLAIRSMEQFVKELLFSLLLASVVIFFVLTMFFRSIRLGLVSIVPNMAPLIVTMGYLGLRGYDLNPGNVMVFAIGLGIAVDDTIHFLARFQDELSSGRDLKQAITNTARGSGKAILLTSVLIIGGMLILLNSSFVPTRRFAELTIVTMSAALAGDLILLPAMIRLVYGKVTVKSEVRSPVSPRVIV